ncbi:hypothetical protein AURDEDRAFT_167485 [Auricularia subglabra TFB-10046 SS5]|nr:hypothetical protein AURDEDRAFT_167485 [Auricularia subglabra TFB-10046 SS5]
MSSPAFDLASLLQDSYGSIDVDIERLSGGYVNYTARVRVRKDDAPKSWNGASPVIVKHATPYLFTSGPEAPFSQYRQTIEARALALFTAEQAADIPASLDHLLHEKVGVRVPLLLDHRQETHLLVQEDLEPLHSVADWLCDVASLPTPEEAYPRGGALGQFLAAVHLATRDPSTELCDFFENETSDVLIREVVEPLRPAFADAGVEDGDELCQLLINDMKGDATPDELLCFSHGDLWHASILSAADFLAVIDWEFAAINVLGNDVSQSVAYLELLRLSPRTPHAAPVKAFTRGLLDTYETALEPSLTERIQTTLRLSYGLNLGNGTVWQTLCDCKLEPTTLCDHARRGVRDAATWLRQARDGVVEPSWFDVVRTT